MVGRLETEHEDPTHWMPLPEPPSHRENERATGGIVVDDEIGDRLKAFLRKYRAVRQLRDHLTDLRN